MSYVLYMCAMVTRTLGLRVTIQLYKHCIYCMVSYGVVYCIVCIVLLYFIV